jgi:hypothetical protein
VTTRETVGAQALSANPVRPANLDEASWGCRDQTAASKAGAEDDQRSVPLKSMSPLAVLGLGVGCRPITKPHNLEGWDWADSHHDVCVQN